MSTRAQIGFYDTDDHKISGWDALVYKHSDGYPEGVLPLLQDFCRMFNKNRGLSDSEYAAARYVTALCNQREKDLMEWRKESPHAFPKGDKPDLLGVGISKDFHGDIEYFYAVSPHRIAVYSVSGAPSDEAVPEKVIEL